MLSTRSLQGHLSMAVVFVVFALCVSPVVSAQVSGNRTAWQPIEVTFTGPSGLTEEGGTNPFLDYRLQVEFTSGGKTYDVPGFYDGVDGDGNSIWKVRFTPDQAGQWDYTTSFRTGSNVAVSLDANAGSAVQNSFNGTTGSVDIAPRDANAPGFLSKGRLAYTGGHYLQTLGDGKYWIKSGADSPENFLGYHGFDNTISQNNRGPSYPGLPNGYDNLHQYPTHRQDWNPGDPDWTTDNGSLAGSTGVQDGRNIIGALNYLGSKGVNSIYFLPMNEGGDGQDTNPYVDRDDQTRFDVSKLQQWETVFTHAQKQGINLHVVLNEAENNNKRFLDNATLGNERKLFYREMAARFGHHNGLYWNMSEEYNRGLELSPETIRAFANYLDEVDVYDHPTTVHNGNFGDWVQAGGTASATPGQHDDVSPIGQRNEQEPFLGDEFTDTVDGTKYSNAFHDLISFQSYAEGRSGDDIEYFRERSAAKGKPIPVMIDEPESLDHNNFSKPTGHTNDSKADSVRQQMTWDIFLSGGGVEWFVRQQDQALEDLREFDQVWEETAIAREFMEDHLPFWEMTPNDDLLVGEDSDFGGGEVFAKAGEVYAFYLPDGSNDDNDDSIDGSPELDLSLYDAVEFTLRWFNPRTGEFEGQEKTLIGGGWVAIGATPDGFGTPGLTDWVGLVTVIPEPGVFTLSLVGGLAFLRHRRVR
ncbi:MAG: DUF5060 domain-containing protein [Planctomycetota bacterium]